MNWWIIASCDYVLVAISLVLVQKSPFTGPSSDCYCCLSFQRNRVLVGTNPSIVFNGIIISFYRMVQLTYIVYTQSWKSDYLWWQVLRDVPSKGVVELRHLGISFNFICTGYGALRWVDEQESNQKWKTLALCWQWWSLKDIKKTSKDIQKSRACGPV